MNDPSESLPDELLEDLLAPLRAVNISDEVRAANRDAVRRALTRRERPPWWRRTVAVPVPVAIAATVMLAVTAAALFWLVTAPQKADRRATGPMQDRFVETGSASKPGKDYVGGPTWSVTRSYIQSLQSPDKLQVPLHLHPKEPRDES